MRGYYLKALFVSRRNAGPVHTLVSQPPHLSNCFSAIDLLLPLWW